LVDCDRILVMDGGRAVDTGPHRDLVERCAIYRQLWLQQNRHIEATGARHPLLKPVIATP
jgi:ABC-type transport system involved in cytochrome bd biosynthesis fused ATPase/permease subunit